MWPARCLGCARQRGSCALILLDAIQPRGIVWLASYPKSGNTWVRAFLYTLLMSLLGTRVDNLDLDAVAYFGESDRLIEYYVPYLPDPGAVRDRAAVAMARPKVQAAIASGSPGPVMIKTHNALIDYLGALLGNRAVSAVAVYVLRNPLDVVISLSHFRGLTIDAAIEDMATAGASTETNDEDVYFVTSSWSEHVASWTGRPTDAILPVRYEDLLAKPTEMFTAIAAHVRMPATPEQIAHAIELTTFERMQKAEAEKGFLEKPPHLERFFREGRAGQWRETLTTAQIERIVATQGEQMARFGYLPT